MSYCSRVFATIALTLFCSPAFAGVVPIHLTVSGGGDSSLRIQDDSGLFGSTFSFPGGSGDGTAGGSPITMGSVSGSLQMISGSPGQWQLAPGTTITWSTQVPGQPGDIDYTNFTLTESSDGKTLNLTVMTASGADGNPPPPRSDFTTVFNGPPTSFSAMTTPEPSTWLLSILGFGLLGVAVRWKRRSTAKRSLQATAPG
jgi:hypothetical protein